MGSLSDILAAQKAATPTEEPTLAEKSIPTPDPVDVGLDIPTPRPAPLAVTLPEGAPITVPAESVNRHGIMVNTSGSFIDPLHSHFSPAMPSAITPTGEALDNVFLAVDRSRKGYQWSRGIIRPNVFGQYIAGDLEEQQFLEALVDEGIMEVSPTPQPF